MAKASSALDEVDDLPSRVGKTAVDFTRFTGIRTVVLAGLALLAAGASIRRVRSSRALPPPRLSLVKRAPRLAPSAAAAAVRQGRSDRTGACGMRFELRRVSLARHFCNPSVEHLRSIDGDPYGEGNFSTTVNAHGLIAVVSRQGAGNDL